MKAGGGYGCFCSGDFEPIRGAAAGALQGLTFAVKDLIDTSGSITGAGNPDWRRTHAVATEHAVVVQQLLAAGATLVGRTVTDELAFSLEGENFFEGTPVNPIAHDRLPGGSSSGSAAAVAAGLVDFALGTDTGGSVRVPAAFCGVHGFRPTHGVVSTAGVVPFAPGLDTVGWLARDASILAAVGHVMLPATSVEPIAEMLIAADVLALADPEVRTVISDIVDSMALRCLAVNVFPGASDDMARAYQIVQAVDIVESLGPWLKAVQPQFGPTIAPRFASIHDHDAAEVAAARGLRNQLCERVSHLFAVHPNAVLILPSAPTTALRRGLAGREIEAFYRSALAMGAVASFSGAPQISIPFLRTGHLPVGFGAIAGVGKDRDLLAFANSQIFHSAAWTGVRHAVR